VKIACLDLEGVLIPEIWINVAERTGIDALRRTTRDEPDYDRLMRGRLEILDRHGLGLPDIQRVIAGMGPLEGARDFIAWLRERFQVLILSDTFYEFAAPLMPQLDRPTLFCHRLETDASGRITAFQEKPKDPAPMPGHPHLALVSKGNYLFRTDVLRRALREDADAEPFRQIDESPVLRGLGSREHNAIELRDRQQAFQQMLQERLTREGSHGLARTTSGSHARRDDAIDLTQRAPP